MEPSFPFPALHRFLTSGGRIAVGCIAIIDGAGIAADAETLWAVPDSRQGEALHDLLKRLNDTLEQGLARNARPIEQSPIHRSPIAPNTIRGPNKSRKLVALGPSCCTP